MSTKICKKCCEEKLLSSFSGRNAICKPCRNKMAVSRYNDQKKNSEQRSKLRVFMKILESRLEEFKTIVQSSEVTKAKVQEQHELLNEAVYSYLEEDDVIELPKTVSESASEFLKLCFDMKVPNELIVRFLTRKADNNTFENLFAPKRQDVADKIYAEVSNLIEEMYAIAAMYEYIHNLSTTTYEKLKPRIYYEPYIGSIVIDNIVGMTKTNLVNRMRMDHSESGGTVQNNFENGIYKTIVEYIDASAVL